MSEDFEQTGLDAVDKFLDTWNSRDPEAWAGSLKFPHVRPSPFGEIVVAENSTDYIARVDFAATVASGWDHSEWDYKHVLHTSPQKIHVAGQWSRYNETGDIILTTPIIYIVTKSDGAWGIQSRFGADYADEETDTTGLMTRGLNLIQDFVNQHNAGNREVCAEMLNYPHIVVEPGTLALTHGPADFKPGDYQMNIESLQALQTGLHSMNAGIELTLTTDENRVSYQGVVNLTVREHHLGIQAWSFLNPEAKLEEAPEIEN